MFLAYVEVCVCVCVEGGGAASDAVGIIDVVQTW